MSLMIFLILLIGLVSSHPVLSDEVTPELRNGTSILGVEKVAKDEKTASPNNVLTQLLTRSPRTAQAPWVVMIEANGRCSGFILTQTIVVTSAHCAPDPGTNITITATYNGIDNVPIFVGAAQFHKHPDFNFNVLGSDRPDDIGFYILPSNLPVSRTGQATIFADIENEPWIGDNAIGRADAMVTVIGWGRGSPTTGAKDCGDLSFSDGGVKRISDDFILHESYGVSVVSWVGVDMTRDHYICPGDSGSPWMLKRNSQLLVIGVHSGGGEKIGPVSSTEKATLLRPKLDWIKSKAASEGTFVSCMKKQDASSNNVPYLECLDGIEGEFSLRKTPSTDQYLDVSPPVEYRQGVLVLANKSNSESQKWIFKQISQANYTIQQKSSGKYLETRGDDLVLVSRPNGGALPWGVRWLGLDQVVILGTNLKYLNTIGEYSIDSRNYTRVGTTPYRQGRVNWNLKKKAFE